MLNFHARVYLYMNFFLLCIALISTVRYEYIYVLVVYTLSFRIFFRRKLKLTISR